MDEENNKAMEAEDETLKALDKSIEHWEDNALQVKRWDRMGHVIHRHGYLYTISECNGNIISFDASSCALCKRFRTSINLSNDGCSVCPLGKYDVQCDSAHSVWMHLLCSNTNDEIISNCERMLNTLLDVRVKYLAEKAAEKAEASKEKAERPRFGLEGDKDANVTFRLTNLDNGERIMLEARDPQSMLWWSILYITRNGTFRRCGCISKETLLQLDDVHKIIEDGW